MFSCFLWLLEAREVKISSRCSCVCIRTFHKVKKNNNLSINPEESAVIYGLNEATQSEIEQCAQYVREQLLHYS